MKTKLIGGKVSSFVAGILAAILLFSLISCDKKIVFLNSSVTPAAEGYVKVKEDKNNNYVIQINISNLAEVERLEPSKVAYTVWMVTDKDGTKNIGRITSSKNLNASLETTSPFKPNKIFITAEETENVKWPSELIVLTTDKF